MLLLSAPGDADGPLPLLPPAGLRVSLRTRMGLKQEDAAAELGVSKNSYGFWERGERTPNAGNIRMYYAQLYGWQQAIRRVS
jgi:DNA-binding XRE family transcriptional regulator